MGIIRQLPPSVVNQIAAGEVVERPASVVKELLENAIDAGANRIVLTVERGGKDLVRVTDDGKGMAPDDLPTAFLPHATSKLVDAEDLFRVRTLGFRGEALAAIAEVSKVRCQSRTGDATAASEIEIEGGSSGPVRPCGGAIGTTIEVRQLFYNTPVRRSFLKADSTEAGHVAEIFSRVALGNHQVHFTYRSAGRVVYDLPASSGLKERIAVFFGRELADSLVWVEGEVEGVKLWGYVGHPSQNRSNAKGQFFFLAGRSIRDRALSHALNEAYRGLLMVGRQPVAFLFLEVPPDEVDVNVHPCKIEVRFRDSPLIYSHLLSTIRRTFLASDLHARLQAPPAEEESIDEATVAPARTGSTSDYRLNDVPVARQEVASWFPTAPTNTPSGLSRPASDTTNGPPPRPTHQFPEVPRPGPAESFDEFSTAGEDLPRPPQVAPETPSPARSTPRELPARALQVHDTYLVAETREGMVVIDQHALHERILFEELKARIERGGIESQRLLVPEPVNLTAAESEAILGQRDVLARLGIEIEPFGGDTVLVASTPAMLSKLSPDRLLRDLVDHFRSRELPPSRDALLEDVLSLVACKAAIKANQRLTPEEIEALLERRHLVQDSHHCPHGRPTALVFTKSELEKQFGRI